MKLSAEDREASFKIKEEAYRILAGQYIVDGFGQVKRYLEIRRYRGRLEMLKEHGALSYDLSIRELPAAYREEWPWEQAWDEFPNPESLLLQPLFLCEHLEDAIWIARYRRFQQFHFMFRVDGDGQFPDRLSLRAEAVIDRMMARWKIPMVEHRFPARKKGESDQIQFRRPEELEDAITPFRNRLQDRWERAAALRAAELVQKRFPAGVKFRPPTVWRSTRG